MNKSTKIILFSVIALFIAGMALYPAVKKQLKKENTSLKTSAPAGASGGRKGSSLNVNVKIMQPETLVNIIPISTATIIPDEEVDLTFETPGKITGIFFREGSSVKKGQLLAKVNDRSLQAELQKLQAQIPLAEDRVFRQKSLLEKDAVSKEAYEQVTTELDKLMADIELTKARIAQTELLAPFDGIIGLRNVSEGAYASPSTIITSLTKIIPLKIEFSVNEKQADYVSPGMEIAFQTPPDLTVYKAAIYAIETRVDPKTYTLKVRASYPNANGRMRPGRSASVEIHSTPIYNALTAPSESVIKEMGRDIAYICSGGKAKQVTLDIGMRTASDLQIINGLNSGDTLIISGVMQLRDGLPVIIDNYN
ncbi:MAG: efflux RND transporter periplasmic adaptor subunit [Candidatus Azobacteroides sp.]|nr:efflux RND transporter periplasmic adaptor subunit [Candidatus Azobacteroides sp.]